MGLGGETMNWISFRGQNETYDMLKALMKKFRWNRSQVIKFAILRLYEENAPAKCS